MPPGLDGGIAVLLRVRAASRSLTGHRAISSGPAATVEKDAGPSLCSKRSSTVWGSLR